MPSGYAHHRFGTQVLAQLSADVRGPILRHRELFDMGLHGPDFLFFHHYIKQTPIYYLGSAYHKKSGREFFTDACARVAENPSEEACAYLYGLLGHYCLDSGCHPFVYEMTEGTGLGHSELETEFDRYLMALDGIQKPHEHNIFRRTRLSAEAYRVIARFYPELSPKDTATCIRNMIASRYLLTLPTALGHKAVELFTRVVEGNTGGQHMTMGPNTRCDHLDERLFSLYQQSVERFPGLLEQLQQHMVYKAPFGEDFKVNFNKG